MKFSIIVPIYKTEKYIRQCIDSLLGQTYTDFEIIAVDDGSPDTCPAIVDEYAASDPRVIALHKENGGLVSARKAGMTVATGEYILNVDSDDYLASDMLSSLAHSLQKEAVDALFFGFTLTDGINNMGKRLNAIPTGTYTDDDARGFIGKYLYDKELGGLNGGCALFNICCKAIKTELYRECQAFVPDSVVSGEDTLFTFHLLQRITSLTVTELDGYFYRQNPTSIEHAVTDRDFRNLVTLCEEMTKTDLIYNNVCSYALQRVWALSIRGGRSASGYKSFKAHLRDSYYMKASELARKARMENLRWQDKLAVTAVRYKLYPLIYLLSKTWFKNKDM